MPAMMTSPRILLITRASILDWTEWWMEHTSPHTSHYKLFHSWWHLAAFIYWGLKVWDSSTVYLILFNVDWWYKNETRDKIRSLNNCTGFLSRLYALVLTIFSLPCVFQCLSSSRKLIVWGRGQREKKLLISIKHAVKEYLSTFCLPSNSTCEQKIMWRKDIHIALYAIFRVA